MRPLQSLLPESSGSLHRRFAAIHRQSAFVRFFIASLENWTLRAQLRLREELSQYFNRRGRPPEELDESAIMPGPSDARLRQVAAVDLA